MILHQNGVHLRNAILKRAIPFLSCLKTHFYVLVYDFNFLLILISNVGYLVQPATLFVFLMRVDIIGTLDLSKYEGSFHD